MCKVKNTSNVFIGKTPNRSGPMHLKPVPFKGQLSCDMFPVSRLSDFTLRGSLSPLKAKTIPPQYLAWCWEPNPYTERFAGSCVEGHPERGSGPTWVEAGALGSDQPGQALAQSLTSWLIWGKLVPTRQHLQLTTHPNLQAFVKTTNKLKIKK